MEEPGKWSAQGPALAFGGPDDEYILDMCPLTKFDGRLQSLDEEENGALNWLEITATIYTQHSLNEIVSTV